MAIKNIIESHAKEKAYKKYPISIIKDSLEVRKFHEIARIGFVEGFMTAMTGYDEIDNIDQLKERYFELKHRIKNLVDAYNDEAINLFDQSHVLAGNNKAETLIKADTIAKIVDELKLIFKEHDC